MGGGVKARAHLVLLVLEGDFQGLGGADHGLHRSEDVLVDQFSVAFPVLVCVARAVNDPHLLDEGAFAAFSSAFGRREGGRQGGWGGDGEIKCPRLARTVTNIDTKRPNGKKTVGEERRRDRIVCTHGHEIVIKEVQEKHRVQISHFGPSLFQPSPHLSLRHTASAELPSIDSYAERYLHNIQKYAC